MRKTFYIYIRTFDFFHYKLLIMKKFFSLLLFTATLFYLPVSAQKVDKVKFFEEESTVNATLEMDLKDLLAKKAPDRFLPATISFTTKDGTTITEKIEASVRGNFRRETCFMPGLKLNFKKDSNSSLYKFKELKLSNGCNTGDESGQLVVKEFLAYKIYNQLTDMSLRVRFMNVSFKDVSGKKKPYTQYAFLIEDVDEMAKRNNMVEIEGTAYNTEQTNRDQMTIVTLFEYLIANTDWSVPAYHNVKLIGPKDVTGTRPYVVAYDFDICGFVDPPYATIDEQLQEQISSVRERLNRGFPRTMEELKVAVKLYNDKKEKIIGMIKSNEYLSSKEKSKSVSYVEDFYKIINSDKDLKRIFVDGGRQN